MGKANQNMQKCLTIFFVIIFFCLTGQQADSVKRYTDKKNEWDTTKYIRYTKVFIVGLYQSYRNFGNEFESLINTGDASAPGSAQYFMAESNLITGVNVCFDKFAFGFSTRSNPPTGASVKGKTKLFNIGFNVGDNRYVIENYYRRFTGFYESKYPVREGDTGAFVRYNLRPQMVSSLFMSRFMYFTNHKKFSFKSGFGCNYRQLKSAASWIFGGDINVYNLTNDSSFFEADKRYLYGHYANLNGFRSIGISVHGGVAATIVLFKAWFASGFFTLGPEQQWRRYTVGGTPSNISYISWSGTGRVAAGINLKRCYWYFSFSNDYAWYDNSFMKFRVNSISGNLAFGWRFNVKSPSFYEKFKNTKFYGML